MFRFTTAGESHGRALVAILEGMPAGLPVDVERINRELERRQSHDFAGEYFQQFSWRNFRHNRRRPAKRRFNDTHQQLRPDAADRRQYGDHHHRPGQQRRHCARDGFDFKPEPWR